MRVRAIREGYDNTAVRQPGDEFDMPDDTQIDEGCWFEPVGGKKKKPAPEGSGDGQGGSQA